MLIAIILAVFVLGGAALVHGIRGRPTDDHPLCRLISGILTAEICDTDAVDLDGPVVRPPDRTRRVETIRVPLSTTFKVVP